MQKITFTIIILFALAFPLWPSIMFDPSLHWRTITTPNFRIHYHDGIAESAQKLAAISEKIHQTLSARVGWDPFFRTDIVLVDNMDMANGFATPFPYNRIQIFISRPMLDSVINNFDEWLKFVFIHEYTHILNLDTIAGVPSISRYTLGRCCFPNIFLPLWQIEGSAVYQESYGTIFGRNNSSFTDMVLRCDIAANTFKAIYEASHYPRRWPSGSVPYLYGGLFIEFIERKYGRDTFSKVFLENADNVVPYLVNYNLNCIYKKSGIELYSEWKSEAERIYTHQIQKICSLPLTKFQFITSTGYNTTMPRFHPNGSSLYWIKRTAYDAPSLMSYSFTTKKTAPVCVVHHPLSIAVTNGGTIYCSDIEFYRSFSLYADIFEYNGNYRQKTKRLRSIYLDATPDGDTMCFITQNKNAFSLLKKNLITNTILPVIDETTIQLAFPKISPDGTKIVFTIKDKTSYTDLILIDLKNEKIFRLTNDRAFDIHPAWHPDGTKLIFCSDKTGVYNLFEVNFSTNTINQLTNVIGGAFHPDVSPDGKSIAFAHYNHEGFNIALMKYEILREWGTLEAAVLPKNFFQVSENTGEDLSMPTASRPYTIWTSVLPAFWIPIFYSEELWEGKTDTSFGFQVYGMDTLFQVLYRFSAQAHKFQKRATIDSDLMIGYSYPNFLFSYYDEKLFLGEDEFPWETQHAFDLHRELERKMSAAVHIPFVKYLSTFEMFAAYVYSNIQHDEFIRTELPHKYANRLARMNATLYYSNTRLYAFSISEEDGIQIFLSIDQYLTVLGSDYTFTKLRAEFSEYFPGIFRNHVLYFRTRAALCYDAPAHVVPYRLGRYEKGTSGEPPSEEESWGIRGYPAGLVYGTRLAIATAEYRFPVLQRDVGYSTYPVMFRDLWIQVFGEVGDVWNPHVESPQLRSSAGFELHLKFTAGYMLDVIGFIGYSKGFNEDGESQIYFGFAGIYEGALKKQTKWFDYF
ncbi:MAG: hypothetical protein N2316_03900 [Spirochaetes bacterium]|nr:hypothetical protein [Spirochaetota bacterium]